MRTDSCKGTYSSLLSIWLRVCKIRTQQIITIVLKTILKISRHAENHVKHFKECWNIVFKMHWFQDILKFSFQHITDFRTFWNFKACWKPCQAFQGVLKHSFQKHYGFQQVLKFSCQHALQISEHSEIFKMLFLRCFQHISNIAIQCMHVENSCHLFHIENSTCRKSAWHDRYVTFWKHISQN